MTHNSTPLAVAVKPDPFLLERVVTRQKAERQQSIGDEESNGGGGTAVLTRELPPSGRPPVLLPGMPWMMQHGAGRAAVAESQARPAQPDEPKELDFAPGTTVAATKPPAAPESPPVAPSVVPAAFAAGAVVGAAAAEVVSHIAHAAAAGAATAQSVDAPGRPAGGPAPSFFAAPAAPPNFVEPPMEQRSPQPSPNAGAEFTSPPPSAPAPGRGEEKEYELGDRSDFFASSSKPQRSAPEAAAAPAEPVAAVTPVPAKLLDEPPETKVLSDKGPNDFFDPPVSQPTKKAPVETNGGGNDSMDFFASTQLVPADKERLEAPKRQSAPSDDLFADVPVKSRRIEADDDEAPPKVAKPSGYKPKEKQDADKDEALRLAEDEEEHEDNLPARKSSAPPRRKFSDKNDIKPRKKAHEDVDDESEEQNSKSKKALGFFDSEVKFCGLSMSRMNQFFLIGIIGFVGFVMISVVANFVGSMNGASQQAAAPSGQPGAQQQQPGTTTGGGLFGMFNEQPSISIAGKWGVTAVYKGRPTEGWMQITQNGNDFSGAGQDRGAGQQKVSDFVFQGKLQQGQYVAFNKAYFLFNPETGKPQPDKNTITFEGKVFADQNGQMQMKGIWHRVMKKRGRFYSVQEVTLSGDWEAQQQSSAAPADRGPDPSQQPVVATDSGIFSQVGNMPLQQKFLIGGALGLGVIALAVMGSLTLFGPGGKMNIWEKQKYIPSQFRSQHKKMLRELCKKLEPGGVPLGRRCEWATWKFWEWGRKDVALPPEIRAQDPHMLILGAGDKGKTRLVAKMITHDIESNDRAVVVIDSGGGLIDLVSRWIAHHPKGKELAKRVVLLDPTYKHGSLGYNPLEMPYDGDLQNAASSIVHGFKAIYTEAPGSQSQWNAQTANILRNCAILLMANGKTLTDLPSLLNDNDFRDVMLESVEKRKHERAEYLTLIDTWSNYKKLARTEQWINWVEPILNRVTPMLGDARIRNILTKPHSDINLRDVIYKKKILLVRVAKGQLDQNANLLGSLMVTGVKQAAISLTNERVENQPPVSLYLDGFDNFIEKDTVQAITGGTDKFKIALIGISKSLQGLPEDFRNHIVVNVGTLICFALAKKDGDLLGPQMFRVDGRKIKHQTIQNYFNKVNTSPQFELISDEEKLNIDRVVGQEARTFYLYRVGTVAGVFHLKSHDFNDIPDKDLNQKLLDKMHGIKSDKKKEPEKEGEIDA